MPDGTPPPPAPAPPPAMLVPPVEEPDDEEEFEEDELQCKVIYSFTGKTFLPFLFCFYVDFGDV